MPMSEHGDPKQSMNSGEALSEEMSSAVYLRAVKSFLAKGRKREAYELLQSAVVKYDDDPFLLSYFGYLTAFIAGKYRNGIESCKLAITLFEKKVLSDEENNETKLNAVLYLNLGRTYLAWGKKKDAVDTLQKGLRFDKQNKELLAELAKLGIRKFIPISFLDRSNPINDLVGKMLRKSSDQKSKKD